MNTITKRAAVIGRSIPFRTEDHGDDEVSATDIPLKGIMLAGREIDEILDCSGAYAALFKIPDEGTPEPLIARLAPIKLADKIEEAHVVLTLDKERLYSLKPVRLKDVTLELIRGGAQMSCKVQATPALDAKGSADLGRLVAQMGMGVHVTISYAHNAAQAEMDVGDKAAAGKKVAKTRRARPPAVSKRRGKNGGVRPSAT
jgi:hypothetical protein